MTNSEKILVPALRFNEFDGDWNLKELKEICSFFSGGTPTSTDKTLYSGDIPFIGSGNIYDSKVSNYITEKALNNSSAKLVEVGDLLYALYGANSGEVAISKMYGAVNQAILCIRTKSENIDFIYSLLFLNKEKIVTKYLQGGQGNLSANIVKKLKYHFPRLPEQQKIASFLSAIDDKVQQLTKKKELLEHYKKGVMQQLFSYEKRLHKGELRKGNLGDFGFFYYGKGAPKTSVVKGAPTPCVRYGELYSTFKEEIKEIKSYTIVDPKELKLSKGGEVLVPRVGEKPLEFANCSYLPFPNVAIGEMISVYNTEEDGLFMTYYINARLQKQLARMVEGANVSNLYFRYVAKIEVEIPCVEEQKLIIQFVSSIDTKIESVNTQITQTQSFKKGLLQQMFV